MVHLKEKQEKNIGMKGNRMSKTKPKKPTMNELRYVIDNLIKDLYNINTTAQTCIQTLYHYIEYKEDHEGFTEYTKKISEDIKEKNDEKLKVKDSPTATQDTKDKGV